MTALIDAAAYLRMSDDEQSLSIEQQRREVAEYAGGHGYRLVAEYVDEGISASRGLKGDELRLGYQRLLIDSSKGQWHAVVCWSTSRFTRGHPHEASEGKRILRSNGVHLCTVKEGVIDWNTFDGMIKDSIFNIVDHVYSVSLGKDSLRGRRNTFLQGGYPYGTIPYGYDRLYISGEQRRSIPRLDKTKNLRGWIQSLVINEDEARVVRRIFDLYLNHDLSLAGIALTLNNEGVTGPGRKDSKWTTLSVRRALSNGVYVQRVVIGDPQTKRHAHNKLEREERIGHWSAIVDISVFDDVQVKLSKHEGSPHTGKSGLLQGILRCGHCGYVLAKENAKPGDNRGDKYRCQGVTTGLPVKCKRWTVFESDILPIVAAELVKTVDEETLRLLSASPEHEGRISNIEVLRAHYDSLEKRILKAADDYIDATNPAMKQAIQAKVEQMGQDREETRQRLEALSAIENMGGVERFQRWWDEVKPSLIMLTKDGKAGPITDEVLIEASTADGWEPVGHFVYDAHGHEGAVFTSDRFKVEGGSPVVVQAERLRALLKRLGVQVKVFWKPYKPLPGAKLPRGGHQKYVVDTARLSVALDCGCPDGRNAWAACRGPSRHGCSRPRASPAP